MGRICTEETKLKLSKFYAAKQTWKTLVCPVCNIEKQVRCYSQVKTCSIKCARTLQSAAGRRGGKISASKQARRSKNEMMFAELCRANFLNVKFNVPLFDGWDADVILEDEKIAVLWNGVWHYKSVAGHSVEQVQNRDRIKLQKIAEAGYFAYTIKDLGCHDAQFVESEFEKFNRALAERQMRIPHKDDQSGSTPLRTTMLV